MSDPPRAVTQLSAAVLSVARSTRGRWIFVGWDEARLPLTVYDAQQLSETAWQQTSLYRSSGLSPRRVPYETVEAAEYQLTGPAIDFADTPQQRAQDQVRYVVNDEAGDRHEIALGELDVLGAIADARNPWQVASGASATAIADSTISLYTVFAPVPGRRADRALAMLFRPTLAGAGNEAAFESFVRGTISRLLILDESQPRQGQKGYLEVAGRIAGLAPTGGLASTLVWLRRIGLLNFDDAWFRQLKRSQTRAKGGLARALRAIGLVDIDDETLEELAHPRPDYDVDPLDTGRLLDLAEAMYGTARTAMQPRG